MFGDDIDIRAAGYRPGAVELRPASVRAATCRRRRDVAVQGARANLLARRCGPSRRDPWALFGEREIADRSVSARVRPRSNIRSPSGTAKGSPEGRADLDRSPDRGASGPGRGGLPEPRDRGSDRRRPHGPASPSIRPSSALGAVRRPRSFEVDGDAAREIVIGPRESPLGARRCRCRVRLARGLCRREVPVVPRAFARGGRAHRGSRRELQLPDRKVVRSPSRATPRSRPRQRSQLDLGQSRSAQRRRVGAGSAPRLPRRSPPSPFGRAGETRPDRIGSA